MKGESPTTADPFVRPDPNRERVVAAVTTAALAWAGLYLGWRATTIGGAHIPTALVLLGAEALALAVFAARVRSARHTPRAPSDVPDAPRLEVAAIVNASTASLDELRTTILSLRRAEGIELIQVIDTNDSRPVRGLAERLGATVRDPDIGVEQAVTRVPTPWVLLVDAGDVPTPDVVPMAAAECCAPDAGIVQLGLVEADPTTFEQDTNSRWSLEPFEQQVVRPSLAARGSIPWYGDGPTLVRRAAIEQAGGWERGESTWTVGARVIRSGFRVSHIALSLARVRAPEGFGEALARRRTSLNIAVEALVDGSVRHLRGPERTAHVLPAAAVVGAVQRVLLVAAAVLVLGFARLPLSAPALHLVALAVPTYGLRWAAHLLLGRGRLGRLSVMRAELRTLGVDLVPTARGSIASARRAAVAALLALIAALDLAVVVTALSVWRNWDDRLPGEVAAVGLVLAAILVGVAMEVLIDGLIQRQRRLSRRVKLGLVTCRLEEHEGQLADLSTGGAGVVLPCAPGEAPTPGTVTTVSFRIPDADGAWRSVSTLVHIAHRAPEPDGGTRLGLAFDDPSAAPLDPVIEFLTIDRRLVAMGRRRLVDAAPDDWRF